jgi:hypothetical protein
MAKQNREKNKSLKENLFKGRTGRYLTIFFISAWMFVLGILVGRGTAPVKFDIDKLSRELSELKQEDINEQMERLKVDTESVKPKTDLEFYEELKKNPQQVTRKIQKDSEVEKPRAH